MHTASVLGFDLGWMVRNCPHRPCVTSCINQWRTGKACEHGLRFCNSCKEVWFVASSLQCNHGNCGDGGKGEKKKEEETYHMQVRDPVEFSHRALSLVTPLNNDDTVCNRQCRHDWKTLRLAFCRHNMTSCALCGNAWDGFAQCQCT